MACSFYRWNGGFFGDYWCDKKNEQIDSDIYSRYCRGYSYDECPIYKQSDYSSGCFLTTIVCDILKRDDHDSVLNTMRGFRDNVLQKDQKYFNILKDYDYIGPLLAYKLSQDSKREMIASKIYDYSLTRIAVQINKQNYEQAVTLYQAMTLFFIDHYGFRENYEENRNTEYEIREFDPQTAGHGILQKKILIK